MKKNVYKNSPSAIVKRNKTPKTNKSVQNTKCKKKNNEPFGPYEN